MDGDVRWATPLRDVALHALGLGFIFSMMLGHAPVILPALARVKLLFGWFFYVPLAVLHVSLAVRLFFGPFDFRLLSAGAAGNAAAIAVFAADRGGLGRGLAPEASGLIQRRAMRSAAHH